MSPIDENFVSYFLGATFVVVYAGDRFNLPPLDRSSTTAIRYYTAALFYCLFGLALYSLLIKWPHLLSLVIQGQADAIPPWARDLSSPLLVALLLTVLLPKLPLLAGIDNWMTKQLRYMAAIPYEERRLSAELRKADFLTVDEVRRRVEEQLISRGFDPSDIVFKRSQDLKSLWTTVAILMHHIAEWEGQQKFVRFVGMFSDEWDELQKAYEQLTPRVQKCFRLLREVLPDVATVKGNDAVLEYKKEVHKQVDGLLEKIYHFISRGVLQCEFTHNARCEQLKGLGFLIQHLMPSRLTVDQVVALFLGIYAVMLCGFLLIPRGGPGAGDVGQVLVKVFMITTLNLTSVCCAIYLREWWKQSNSRFRPVACYLAAGVVAVAIGMPINFGFKVLMTWNLQEAFMLFTQKYPWFVTSFTMAFTTAFLCDNKPTQKLPQASLQWVEGGTQMLVSVCSGWLVRMWLVSINPDRVFSLPSLLLVSGVIGFMIGFFVPTWYRQAPSERGDSGEELYPTGPMPLATDGIRLTAAEADMQSM